MSCELKPSTLTKGGNPRWKIKKNQKFWKILQWPSNPLLLSTQATFFHKFFLIVFIVSVVSRLTHNFCFALFGLKSYGVTLKLCWGVPSYKRVKIAVLKTWLLHHFWFLCSFVVQIEQKIRSAWEKPDLNCFLSPDLRLT